MGWETSERTPSTMTGHRFLPQTCVAPDCKRRIARGLLACRSHWFALPGDLRRTISSSFKADDRPTYRLAVYEALQVWCAAIAAAEQSE